MYMYTSKHKGGWGGGNLEFSYLSEPKRKKANKRIFCRIWKENSGKGEYFDLGVFWNLFIYTFNWVRQLILSSLQRISKLLNKMATQWGVGRLRSWLYIRLSTKCKVRAFADLFTCNIRRLKGIEFLQQTQIL